MAVVLGPLMSYCFICRVVMAQSDFLNVYTNYLRIMRFFETFLSLPHLFDIYVKKVVERSRNILCQRTLPNHLVSFLLTKLCSDIGVQLKEVILRRNAKFAGAVFNKSSNFCVTSDVEATNVLF